MEKEKHKEIRNVEIKVLKVKEGESGATIPMDYYAKFNYFMEKDAKEDSKSETADRPATAGKGKSGKAKKDVRSKDEVEKRQLLAALALDEDEAITAAALSEIEAERPDAIINNSGLPDEQVRAIFGPLGIDF